MIPSSIAVLAADSSSGNEGNFASFEVAPWIWVLFLAFVSALLIGDLLIVHRKPHAPTTKEAAIESAAWIGIGVAFTGVMYWWHGGQAATEYISGYLIEKSLSVDNVFVWALIMSYFAVPRAYQFRVLFWGVFGALVVRRVIPSTTEYDGQKLFVRRAGKLLATPLFAVLIVVESSDVVFAVDSIPAILAVSREQFIVFSSNAFAILGLRALYFLLADLREKFGLLQQGLAVILAYVGVKMILAEWYHIPTGVSLGVIAVVLAVSIWLSIRRDARLEGAGDQERSTVGSGDASGVGNGAGTAPAPEGPSGGDQEPVAPHGED